MFIGQTKNVNQISNGLSGKYFYRMDCTTGGSNKTYLLTIAKNDTNQWELVARWGPYGRTTRSQTKCTGSFYECRRHAHTIISEKSNKGYIVSGSFGGENHVWPGK